VISRRLAALVKILAKRIAALPEDLRMILNTDALRPLVAMRSQVVDDIAFSWYEIHRPSVGYNCSSWRVKQVSVPKRSLYEPSEVIKKKEVRYWLDTRMEPAPTIEDIFSPDYAIKGIKSKVWFKRVRDEASLDEKLREKYDVRAVLKEAVRLEYLYNEPIRQGTVPAILPKNESEAVNIYKVKAAILKVKDSVRDLNRIRGGEVRL
jgi:hypothetical protein